MTDRAALPGDRVLRRRIHRARSEVEGFETVNHEQEQLQALVLEMLDYVERLRERPNTLGQQVQWWAAAMAYRRVLCSPVLASKQARSVLPRIVDARWPEVARVAASIERLAGREDST